MSSDRWNPERAFRYDFWTAERVARLIALRADGKSAAEIAAELGAVSRNAVIGKIARMRLALPESRVRLMSNRVAKPHRAPPVRPNRSEVNGTTLNGSQRMGEALRGFWPEEIAAMNTSECAVTIMGLKANSCRWPVGDEHGAGMWYCGSVQQKWPYCERHMRFANQPMVRRNGIQWAWRNG